MINCLVGNLIRRCDWRRIQLVDDGYRHVIGGYIGWSVQIKTYDWRKTELVRANLL